MAVYIVPTVGSGGFFELSSPFDNLMAPGERYICKAIRKLSQYYSNNEDPKTDIYDKYRINSDIFDAHKVEDISVACLQSEKGHWLYVPVSYILKYPDPNGIPYRSVSLVVALPAIPVNTDLGYVETAIKSLIAEYMGINTAIKPVETSRVVLVSSDQHRNTQAIRNANITVTGTDRGNYKKVLQDYTQALSRIVELEQYIIEHQ